RNRISLKVNTSTTHPLQGEHTFHLCSYPYQNEQHYRQQRDDLRTGGCCVDRICWRASDAWTRTRQGGSYLLWRWKLMLLFIIFRNEQ
ncbi:unnamed protein product, partial [Amoebophrya sp. A25]